jgi:ankyrin repeat protein
MLAGMGGTNGTGDSAQLAELREDIADVVNCRSAADRSRTPLMYASERGHAGVVEVLLGAGAEMGAADDRGTTALIAAATNGHIKSVGLLIEAGAEVDAKTQAAEAVPAVSALDQAVSRGHAHTLYSLYTILTLTPYEG